MRTQPCLLPVCLVILVALCGCSAGSKQEDPSNYFLLEVQRQGTSEPVAESIVLMVQPFPTSPGIHQRELVHRRSLSRYETDYYNRFVTDVGSQVAEQTRRWFSESGVFGQVLPPGSSVDATHLLEGNVTRLYSDFRDEGNAQAVMEVEFFLVDVRPRKPVMAFHASCEAAVDISEATAEAVIAAYNRCLSQILTQLEDNLRQADFVPAEGGVVMRRTLPNKTVSRRYIEWTGWRDQAIAKPQCCSCSPHGQWVDVRATFLPRSPRSFSQLEPRLAAKAMRVYQPLC